jgi:hypothetical protein
MRLSVWLATTGLSLVAFVAVSQSGFSAQASLADDIATQYDACLAQSRGADDRSAIRECHALELAVDPAKHAVSATMEEKSKGQQVKPAAFLDVIAFCRSERLATVTIARINAKHVSDSPEVARVGRAYAVQAIGWAMYDTKNAHDVVYSFRASHDPRIIQLVSESKAAMYDDRAGVTEMERLYPGVTGESAVQMRMSLSQYRTIVNDLYKVLH